MIHKLALLTSVFSEEELFEKLAISAKRDREIKELLNAKAKALGYDIPTVKRHEVTPEGLPVVDEIIDTAAMRRKPTRSATAAEKEIQQAHTLATGPGGLLRRHVVSPIKRFWAGMNVFGDQLNRAPIRNRALAFGIVAPAVALPLMGIRHYLENRRLAQPEQIKFSTVNIETVQNMAAVPKPTGQPEISPPSAFVKGISGSQSGGFMPGVSLAGKSRGGGGGKGQSTGGTSGGSAGTKTADDNVTLPLIGAGLGGLGGHLLGQEVIIPLAEKREKALLDQLSKIQEKMENWQKVRKYGPPTVTIAGALLLAALAARRAHQNAREEHARSVFVNPSILSNGYIPQDQINPGQSFY